MSTPAYLVDFVPALGLKHISASELMIGVDKGNDPPPRELLGNGALVLTLWDDARAWFTQDRGYDCPVKLTSFYRSEAFNSATKDSSQFSQHQGCFAGDGKIKGVPAAEVQAYFRHRHGSKVVLPAWAVRNPVRVAAGQLPYAELETIRGADFQVVTWIGGIGDYYSFTHLDSRGGMAARWKG